MKNEKDPNDAGYRLSTTDDYHREDLESLGWELTVCNSLHPEDTPIRGILTRNASYGSLLYDHLRELMPLGMIREVLEIGGGYGYLMKDLLERDPGIRASMLDISPALLKKQRETLAGFPVHYYLNDALAVDRDFLRSFELIVLNENLGDFPTLVHVDGGTLSEGKAGVSDPQLAKARHFFSAYGLSVPDAPFNLNIGALQMVEKICQAEVPYIFIGEHSCESQVPAGLEPWIAIAATGNPRRIALKGHDEYTIKFSYLETIARRLGYRTKRGPFADYIVPAITDHVRAVLASRGLYSDNEEIIYQFIGDLYEYEYLVAIKM